MENNYTVYMHVFPNKKRYIGITSNSVNKRWGNGSGYKKQKRLKNAINKYGWENIEHIILFNDLSKEEASNKEIELISKYNTTDVSKGYNVSLGGYTGNVGLKRTLKQKQNIRDTCREKNGKPVMRYIFNKYGDVIGKQFFNSISKASEITKISKNTIQEKLKKKSNEWMYYSEYCLEKLLSECDDPILYRFLLKKVINNDLYIQLMGGDLSFWKKLKEYDEKLKKSSESQEEKMLL